MTTDLEIDPRLDDLLRRTFEAVADQTPPADARRALVVRLDSVADRRRPRRHRPVGLALVGSAAAAAVTVAVVAGAFDGGSSGDRTSTLATQPSVATTELPSAGAGSTDVTDRVQTWQDLVARALATAGIVQDVDQAARVWTAVPPQDPHLTSYLAQAGEEGEPPNTLVDFELFEPGRYQADPAWAQQVAGAPAPGESVAEGLLFLIPDGAGTVRTAVVVNETGMSTIRVDGDPVPAPDRLAAAVRQVAAESHDLDDPRG